MGRIEIVILLLTLSTTLHSRIWPFQSSILNSTTFNIEDESIIAIGNSFGILEISKKSEKKNDKPHFMTLNSTNNSSIIAIENYESNRIEQYVIVGSLGQVSIWNHDFKKLKFTQNFNQTVLNVAFRQNRNKITDNRVSLNFGNSIVQFSLDKHQQIRRIFASDFNVTLFNSILYLDNSLILSCQDSSLIRIQDNGNISTINGISNINATLLSKHQHQLHGENRQRNTKDKHYGCDGGIAISNQNLIHFNQTRVDFFWPIYLNPNDQITSLNYCQGKVSRINQTKHRKNQDQDLVVIGLNHQTIQIGILDIKAQSYQIYHNFNIEEGIIDINCYGDDVYILTGNNQIILRQLDHFQHTANKLSGMASIMFAVFIMIIVLYQIKQNKDKKQKSKELLNVRQFELHERILNQESL